jgi:general secretion pathway protein A
LLGDAGTGKTTVIRTAIERQPERVHCVHVQNPGLTRAEFIELLATLFDLDERARHSKTIFLLQVEALLREQRQRGESSVLIVDEAQSLPLELLEEIRLLANIETHDQKLLPVILAGQPELADRLNKPSLRQLKQRIALRCELRPLTPAETCAYVAGRVRAAGGVGAQCFSREAVMLIHARAGGIPRIVSVIADNALLTGFAAQQQPVSSRIVTEVCRDLDLDPDAHPARSSTPVPPPLASGGPRPPEGVGSGRLITFDPGFERTTAVPDEGREDSRVQAVGIASRRRRFSFF